jgi:hypothetical protein
MRVIWDVRPKCDGPASANIAAMSRKQARSVEGKIRLWILEQEHDRRMERQLAGADYRARRSVQTSIGGRNGRYART